MAFGSGSLEDIPEPDGDEPKEVFAFFGLASYAAQVLEAELVNLIVATHLVEDIPDNADDIEALFSKHFTLTLGRLLRIASTRASLPAESEALISKALEARNRLAHRFFGDHSENFMSAAGRRDMLLELREMTILFRLADAASEQISGRLFESLGVAWNVVRRELSIMKARAEARDRAI